LNSTSAFQMFVACPLTLAMSAACFLGLIKPLIPADVYPAVSMYPFDGTFAGFLWLGVAIISAVSAILRLGLSQNAK